MPDDAAAVISELTRVLESSAMRNSPQSRAFLAYVVTEELAGRGDRLSERTVGRRALGRGHTFDGRFDASVRVRASRVRQTLKEYYAGEGSSAPLRIELPPGGYAPRFVTRPPVETPDMVAEPGVDTTVVVLHFTTSGDSGADLVGSTVSEAIAQRLSTFPGLRVVGPTSSRSQDPRRIARELAGRFVLQGSVGFREGLVRLGARLTDAVRGDVVWAATETADAGSLTGFDVEEQWASGVAAQLGDFAGVVHRRTAEEPSAVAGPLEYAARLAFQAYVEAGNPATLAAAESALAAAMDAGSSSPVILAMRGTTRAVRATYGLSEDPDADLAAAEQLARQALAADPRSGHAHVVLGTVALTRHHWEAARRHAADAARSTPGHPTILATAGSLTAYAGAWDTGVAMLREALDLNPLHPGYMHTLLAQDRLMARDDAAALAEASLIHAPGGIWGPLFRAMALAGLGHTEQAGSEFEAALAAEPAFLDDPLATFTAYATLTDDQIAALLEHLEPLVARVRESYEESQIAGTTSGSAQDSDEDLEL